MNLLLVLRKRAPTVSEKNGFMFALDENGSIQAFPANRFLMLHARSNDSHNCPFRSTRNMRATQFLKTTNEKGASTVEYALLLSILALGSLVSIGFAGSGVNDTFERANAAFYDNYMTAAGEPGQGGESGSASH